MEIADVVTPAVSAVGASLVAWVGYRQSVRVEKSKLEAGAFDRARGIYESSINELEERIQRLRADLEEVVTDRRVLREQVEQLQNLIMRMRRQLRLAGIDLDEPPTP